MRIDHRKKKSEPRRAELVPLLKRWSAWALLAVVVIDSLSGYAIFHHRIFAGFLNKAVAQRLHITIQPAIAFLLLAHVLLNLRALLTERGRGSRVLDLTLFVVGLVLFGGSVYLASLG